MLLMQGSNRIRYTPFILFFPLLTPSYCTYWPLQSASAHQRKNYDGLMGDRWMLGWRDEWLFRLG